MMLYSEMFGIKSEDIKEILKMITMYNLNFRVSFFILKLLLKKTMKKNSKKFTSY